MFLNKKILLGALVPNVGSFGYLGFSTLNQTETYKIMVNYNGQADLLLSLQIWPDYYPYQFKKTQLYDYLTNIDRYIVVNEKVSEDKKKVKENMQKKLNYLLGQVKEFGPSLWNEDLYDTGLVFRNDQFWSKKKTSILFLEQFISDDYKNIDFEALDILPKYKDLIVTNYRAARDPYTIFGEEVYKCLQTTSSATVVTCQDDGESKKIAEGLKEYLRNYDKEGINALYRTAKYMEFWNKTFGDTSASTSSGLNWADWVRKDKLFSLEVEDDTKLAEKYGKTIFEKEEQEKIKEWNNDGQINYLKKENINTTHHPALEQQIIPGSAPLSEGSQKDIVMFLIQFSKLIKQYVIGSNFNKEFANDPRKEKMKEVEENAKLIAEGIKKRIDKIRDYFKAIGVVDSNFDPNSKNYTTTNSKTFTVLTFPPTSFGAGEATIQSMSKFPFIYHDIGLKQPVPSNLKDESHCSENQEDLRCEIFSVDDNGWWWKIGDARMDPTNLLKFQNTTDSLLLLAHEDDWNIIKDKNSMVLGALGTLLKENQTIDRKQINKGDYKVSYNKYHLWNEGLRSPIALNLLLDNLVDIFQRQYDSSFNDSHQSKYQEAMNWGEYWKEDKFLKVE